ncbi:hypothetical protein CY34DRAFT_148899 [Suillus luteus UH-Slu-Lm8-n1]|uniref:Uncharacterized protein n=1 Tax=Suillus luteus UH-Slu-Lm8-n1 TaxID=930992 RepID=A0A0D0BDQ5_9AGAM|nr:hypothetical protein CY34DRAFT_148899 [Suillus luteus UH-Slu-Lm8-n1]
MWVSVRQLQASVNICRVNFNDISRTSTMPISVIICLHQTVQTGARPVPRTKRCNCHRNVRSQRGVSFRCHNAMSCRDYRTSLTNLIPPHHSRGFSE